MVSPWYERTMTHIQQLLQTPEPPFGNKKSMEIKNKKNPNSGPNSGPNFTNSGPNFTKFYQFWYQISPILVPHFTNSGPNLPNFTKFWTKKQKKHKKKINLMMKLYQ